MQTDVTTNLAAWVPALLAYPGFLFAILLSLAGEWLAGFIRPLLAPRLYRSRPTLRGFFDPLRAVGKLLGRKDAVRWEVDGSSSAMGASVARHPAESTLTLVGALAPLFALVLMPVPGNPVADVLGVRGDLFLVMSLLAVYPLALAAAQARGEGFSVLVGAQTLGAFLTGLLPTLLLVAALVQVADARDLNMDGLLAAPLTPQQTFVRLLAGAALMVALPWWLGRPSQQHGVGPTAMGAGAQAGRLLQWSALAVFWSMLVLPTAGEISWSLAITLGGALFASMVMRLVGDLWQPTRRAAQAANMVWATTLPLAGVALLLSLI